MEVKLIIRCDEDEPTEMTQEIDTEGTEGKRSVQLLLARASVVSMMRTPAFHAFVERAELEEVFVECYANGFAFMSCYVSDTLLWAAAFVDHIAGLVEKLPYNEIVWRCVDATISNS